MDVEAGADAGAGVGADVEGRRDEARADIDGFGDLVGGGMRAADRDRASHAYAITFTNANYRADGVHRAGGGNDGDIYAAVHRHAAADVHGGGKECDVHYRL
ncbi:MAG TPA: hypothetical protein G4N99_03885 [Thermoflexia bacterium]|nr:hypothetical protein [Thermoflexia bacterium]